jgi:hypothetical protein
MFAHLHIATMLASERASMNIQTYLGEEERDFKAYSMSWNIFNIFFYHVDIIK